MEVILLCLVLAIIITLISRFICLKIYKFYIHLTCSIPFGYKNVRFYECADSVRAKYKKPYRQSYKMREEEFYLYYHIEVLEIDTNLIYIFTNENGEQLLTSVRFELECECYNDAKKVVGMLKEKIVRHYLSRTSINEYAEDEKAKHFNNSFKIRNMNFEFDANARFLTLTIKLDTIHKRRIYE